MTNTSFETATLLQEGQSVYGWVDSGKLFRYYAIDTIVGHEYIFTTNHGYNIYDDLKATLYDSNGNELYTDDGSGDMNKPLIAYLAQTSGMIYIKVYHGTSITSSTLSFYAIYTSRQHPVNTGYSLSDAIPLTYEVFEKSQVYTLAQERYFTFNVEEGKQYRVYMSLIYGASYVLASLRDMYGNVLDDNSQNYVYDASFDFVASYTGMYYVLAEAYNYYYVSQFELIVIPIEPEPEPEPEIRWRLRAVKLKDLKHGELRLYDRPE